MSLATLLRESCNVSPRNQKYEAHINQWVIDKTGEMQRPALALAQAAVLAAFLES
jgi:hypothetical protein